MCGLPRHRIERTKSGAEAVNLRSMGTGFSMVLTSLDLNIG